MSLAVSTPGAGAVKRSVNPPLRSSLRILNRVSARAPRVAIPLSETLAPSTAVPLPVTGEATVIWTGGVSLRRLDVSRVVAVRRCAPFDTPVVFQETEYGAVVSSAPMFTPSTLNWTPAIAAPMFGMGRPPMVTVPVTVAPAAGAEMDTVGQAPLGMAHVTPFWTCILLHGKLLMTCHSL